MEEKQEKDRQKAKKEIEKMRRIVNWVEDARIQIERGKKIKRWERGNRMIRETRVERWTGKKMNEIGLEELHQKADRRLHELMKARDEANERTKILEKNLQKMEQIDNDEKGTKYFYQKIKMDYKKEKIEALKREDESDQEEEEEMREDEDEEKEEEKDTRDMEEMKEIARRFYERLWRKRKVDSKQLEEMLKEIKQKLNEGREGEL